MVTLFECWNGGTVQWDGMNPPQFLFAFPAGSVEVIKFFQLSGRICEVLTRTEWYLNIGGQLFDIPNLPEQEVNNFVFSVRNTMGYAATTVPYQLGNPYTGYISIPLILWVSLQTGRADMYSPYTQLVYGQQLLAPQQQFAMPMQASNFSMSMTPQGDVQGGGGKNVLQSIATIMGGVGKIADFLGQTGMFKGNSG